MCRQAKSKNKTENTLGLMPNIDVSILQPEMTELEKYNKIRIDD